MSDFPPQYPSTDLVDRENDGAGLFQFSLASLFIATTALAMILSAYIGVGRLVGMSTMDVVQRGLTQFIYFLPPMLVWMVGLAVAVRQLKRNRGAAVLTLIALGGLLVASVVLHLVQMALIFLVNSRQSSHAMITWGLTLSGLLFSIINAAGWILILMAVFRGRTPDAAAPPRIGEPRSPFGIDDRQSDFGPPYGR
jgi:hypothetical protein